ncbi:MAG: hypothetical protein U5R30_11865 [Deltaproteobacteria bacterium]|nr:hypothetical protein [Deltaproteobacteria bacterium]
MKRINIIMMRLGQCFLIFFIYYVTAHCSFSITPGSICDRIENAPITELTSSSDPNEEKVYEDPGTIVVYHGFGCAQSDKPGTEDFIKVAQSKEVARYAQAAVFLNGWNSKYLNGDKNVAGLATMIRNIRLEGGTLKWEAAGILSDDSFENPYGWCYFYTVIAWNPARIDLLVDQKDGGCDTHDPAEANFFFAKNEGTTTALSTYPTIIQNIGLIGKKTVAIAPRGFGFTWGHDDTPGDHNLLQIGYHMEHAEIFNEKGKRYQKGLRGTTTSGADFSFVDKGYVSWEAHAIFKDDDGRRNYQFGEMVSALAGDDLGVIQPPFSILPIEDEGGILSTCVSGPGPLKTEELEIDNIPYEYAVPMLTGWELGYHCGDNNVEEIGMWIDKWSYQKDPGAAAGKLRYTLSSILRDKNGKPYFDSRHKVTVLGLKPVVAGVKPIQSD